MVFLLPTLHQLLGQVYVPAQVRDELVLAAPLAAGVAALQEALRDWLQVVELDAAGDATLEDLVDQVDEGEAAVIALAIQLGADLVVMDDLAGRRAARRAGLSVVGTVGLLVEARRIGLLAALVPVLSEMRARGLWISDALARSAVEAVGEEDD